MSEFPRNLMEFGDMPFANSAFLPHHSDRVCRQRAGSVWRTGQNSVDAARRRARLIRRICRNDESRSASCVEFVWLVERKTQCLQVFAHGWVSKPASKSPVSITSLKGRLLTRHQNAHSDSVNQRKDRSPYAPFTHFSGLPILSLWPPAVFALRASAFAR